MSNKVWLVVCIDDHESYVTYVASTEELAYEYLYAHPSLERELYGVSIHEWVVDKPYEPEPKEGDEDG